MLFLDIWNLNKSSQRLVMQNKNVIYKSAPSARAIHRALHATCQAAHIPTYPSPSSQPLSSFANVKAPVRAQANPNLPVDSRSPEAALPGAVPVALRAHRRRADPVRTTVAVAGRDDLVRVFQGPEHAGQRACHRADALRLPAGLLRCGGGGWKGEER